MLYYRQTEWERRKPHWWPRDWKMKTEKNTRELSCSQNISQSSQGLFQPPDFWPRLESLIITGFRWIEGSFSWQHRAWKISPESAASSCKGGKEGRRTLTTKRLQIWGCIDFLSLAHTAVHTDAENFLLTLSDIAEITFFWEQYRLDEFMHIF